MRDERTVASEGTAVLVALWRAMHVKVDPPPHVIEHQIGHAISRTQIHSDRRAFKRNAKQVVEVQQEASATSRIA
jgi:hypothetical protein